MDLSIWIVFIGTALIGICAALVGTFTFLQKKSLIGDAISHAILPGIVLAYMATGYRSTAVLMLGAFIAGWLATQQISWLQRKTKLKSDTIVAATLSIFFAFGLALLSYIQGRPDDGQAGLSDFLFGKIAALNLTDLILFSIVSFVIITMVFFRYRVMFSFAFNKEFMISKGFSIRWNDFILNSMTILVVAMGVQAVGVVLMSALLIIPVLTARMLTYKFNQLIILALIFGTFSSLVGSFISILGRNIPTGPCIILVLSLCAIIVAFIVRMQSKTKSYGK
ncbi:metal ABC transporter permease [Fluviicola taffensis]|uniref:ABC-3 protein n=1 Tax=Fluviicola taffensis (strain DSM 16823 / NCIMB 13979 / RW262) TaxID=755732 RepID=F2IDU3_FLUTR|nr:metal ABC transporter permease [Fluviicola taffensis]AEA44485.1 ABC-3 protein [Fluviicola taffensis DSM 16823]